jgi:endonuclease G
MSNSNDIRKYFPTVTPVTEVESTHAKPEHYDDRDGYNSKFLGNHQHFEVILPVLKNRADMVSVERSKDGRPFELCYRHFSVVMSRSRRLCCVSGVNIDGGQPFFHPKRPGWKIDPRIPAKLQVDGASFYVPTSFDRGHMVRRLDPVWGDEGDALQANDDTHHYTNSCPQVHSFNDMTWGNLEDWILSQQQSRESKGSVFTGPIFQVSDKIYAGVQVPVEFYKVIVVVDDALNQLSVTAFCQSQINVMPKQEGVPTPEAGFDPGHFSVDQITLAELEQMTGLEFGQLKDFDVLAAHPVPESTGLQGSVRLPLSSYRDAVLWAPRSQTSRSI